MKPARPDLKGLFGRLPPHAPEAEMSLLGSLILDARLLDDLAPTGLAAGDFYSERHAVIFEAIARVREASGGLDLVRLADALGDVLKDVGGADYLVSLAECVPSAVNAPHYARIVLAKSRARALVDAAARIAFEAHAGDSSPEGVQAMLDAAEQSVYAIADAGRPRENAEADVAVLLERELDAAEARRAGGAGVGVLPTGFHDLDEMMGGGLRAGEMVVVAARPAMGKTALATGIMEGVARASGVAAGLLSLEMSKEQIAQRLMCGAAGVDLHRFRRGMLGAEDFRRLAEAAGGVASLGLIIDDTPGMTIGQARAAARRLVSRRGVGLIVIDYLQLMTDPSLSRGDGRQVEVASISRGVKAMARELRVPVVVLSQLNRQAEQREGNRPRMSDLRESGSIEQDADAVLLLHREEYYHLQDPDWSRENPDKAGVAEVIVAKQRNGPTGVVPLAWDAPRVAFRSLARHSGGGGERRAA